MAMDLIKKTQIEAQIQALIKALLFDEAPTAISAEYSDYRNVF